MLQAEGQAELDAWTGAIRDSIERALTASAASARSSSGGNGSGGNPIGSARASAAGGGGGSSSSGIDAARVETVLSANAVCADCGAPGPDWASISLGVVVCV